MVMSYQGARKIPEKETQNVQVKDYMTKKLITFSPEQAMYEVIATLAQKNISGGPVVDEQGNLVGMISEGDCLNQVVKGMYNNSPNHHGKVKDHMTTDVKTISPDLNIFDLAQNFLDLKLRRFPVMDDGKLVGQISQRDVMQAVLNLNQETW